MFLCKDKKMKPTSNRPAISRFQIRDLFLSGAVWLAFLAAASIPLNAYGLQPQKPTPRTTRVPASIRGVASASIFGRVSGHVNAVKVDIGDVVKKGQLLAEIEVPEIDTRIVLKESELRQAKSDFDQANAKVAEAEAQIDSCKAEAEVVKARLSEKEALVRYEQVEFDRIKRLEGSGAIELTLMNSAEYKLASAKSQLYAVKAQIAAANADLVGARAGLNRTKADAAAAQSRIHVAEANIELVKRQKEFASIRAPWDGKVVTRMVDSGDFVHSADGNSAAKPLFELVRDEQVQILFSLSIKNIAMLKIGDRVVLQDIEALPGKVFEGKVSRFSASLDEKTRMLRVEVDLDNKDQLLRVGYFGYATVYLNE